MVDIQEYYEQYWSEPEAYSDVTTPQRQDLLKRHIAHLPRGSRILDAGCGRGEFCAFFKSLGHHAEGIDISNAAIEYARRQHPDIAFHCGEIASLLPEKAGAFDCVFSSEVIEHLFDVKSYLESARSLLKPEGVLIITTPYHGFAKNLMIDLFGYSRHYDPMGQHIRFFDRRGLDDCLKQSGLASIEVTGYGRMWPLWKSFFVVCRKREQPAQGNQTVA
jgi:2-polyprenyl-6-hydroxyphenyl methylase/3-demethylubiquinone-9 3-methyltransferase